MTSRPHGKDSGSTVGILFEVKKPGNKSEMPTCENINTKAFHELILYYLRERITNINLVYELYGLTEEEIRIAEGQITPTGV